MYSRAQGVDRLVERVGQQDALFLASGSAAIEMALEVLEVGPGDEVIVPDIGCHSVGASVARRGATVVFVGVGETLTLSPSDAQTALSGATKAVIGVHQYGLPCDIREIRRAVPSTVAVVEDFAQAWGLEIAGEVAGSLGDLSVTSFGHTKPLSLGAGGALFGRLEMLREGSAVNEREQARLPSGARFPTPLLSQLSDAIEAADRAVTIRRRSVRQILELTSGWSIEAAPVDSQCHPSWTRLPLYSRDARASIDALRSSSLIQLTQLMHETPPSGLPMFRGVPTRAIEGTSRVREPLLIKPSSGMSEA
jgi:hypothetical protein